MLCRGTKTTRDIQAAPRTAGGVTQVTSQSVRQRHMLDMQGCQGLQLRRSSCAPQYRSHTAASNRAAHAALELPPHRKGKVQLGRRFQGPWPASPDRVGWASNCQPATRTHQIQVRVCRGAFPAPFLACVVPSLLEAHKLLSTNF